MIKTGSKVRLARDVERFDSFLAPKGLTGTVRLMMDGDTFISVKMDALLAGAEYWNNCIEWYDMAEFLADVELVKNSLPTFYTAKTWTTHKFFCTECQRERYASQEAIDWTRAADSHFPADVSDATIASDFQFCLSCLDGKDYAGEDV